MPISRTENYAGPILSVRWIRVVVTVSLFLQVLLSYLWVALVHRARAAALAKVHYKNAERVYRAFILLKGVYIKVGQFLSTQVILPPPYLMAMARMQDRVPKAHTDAVLRRLQETYDKPIDEVFAQFDLEPLATASIGQVHRGKLRDGRDVVVKVRYPGITRFFMSDLRVIEVLVPWFVRILEWAFEGGLSGIDHRSNVGELVHYLRQELDYVNERNNHLRMIDVLRDYPEPAAVKVPAIYPEYCGHSVIVMEYVEAENLGHWFLRKEIAREVKDKVYATLFRASVHTILRHGYFQADPHPGNYMVTPDLRVVFIDFGCTQQLPGEFHRGILQVIGGFLGNNPRMTAEALWNLGFRTRQHNVESLQVWTDYGFAIIKEVMAHFERGDNFIEHLMENAMTYANEALRLRDEHRIAAVPKSYVMLGRALATPPVPYNKYQPKLDLQAIVMPYVFDLTTRGAQTQAAAAK